MIDIVVLDQLKAEMKLILKDAKGDTLKKALDAIDMNALELDMNGITALDTLKAAGITDGKRFDMMVKKYKNNATPKPKTAQPIINKENIDANKETSNKQAPILNQAKTIQGEDGIPEISVLHNGL